MGKNSILLVEDNALLGTSVKELLEKDGYQVTYALDGASANAALAADEYAVALVDLMLPDTDGQTLLGQWQRQYPAMLVIIMSAYGDISKAVESIKAGARDFLAKPVEKVLLRKTIKNAFEQKELVRKVTVLTQLSRRETTTEEFGHDIVATSSALRDTIELSRLVAESDFSCLFIRGESGTGKGLFARSIHKAGKRSEKPFVEVNCSALPATLIESELFGHKRGAFTDAKEDKVGLFELADGGTLFLDEIGDMDVALQVKLLKAIEDQRLRRIGDTRDIEVDVAIIAATNQNAEELVAKRKFREDLYYRLNVVPLQLPPLREHPEDIPALCDHFIRLYARKFGKNIVGFSDEAMAMFSNYSWPGNVRELRNVVERGCLLTQSETISTQHLLLSTTSSAQSARPSTPGAGMALATPVMSLVEVEQQAIRRAMAEAEGNKNEAARLLGVHRTTLYKKLAEYGIA